VGEFFLRVLHIADPQLNEDPFIYFKGKSRVFVPDPKNPAYVISNPSYTQAASEYKDIIKGLRFLQKKPKKYFRIFLLGGSSVNQLEEKKLQ